jgi:hypothetical protein
VILSCRICTGHGEALEAAHMSARFCQADICSVENISFYRTAN